MTDDVPTSRKVPPVAIIVIVVLAALVAIAFAAPSLTTIYGPVTLGAVAPGQRGKLIVVIYSGNAISALASNAATGWIVGEAGPDAAAGYAHAMLFTAAVLFVGAAAAFLASGDSVWITGHGARCGMTRRSTSARS